MRADLSPAEQVIDAAIRKNQEETDAFGRIGYLLAQEIAEALREKGMLNEFTFTDCGNGHLAVAIQLMPCPVCGHPLKITETCGSCGNYTKVRCPECHASTA